MDKYVELWLTDLSERAKENYFRELPKWVSFVKLSPTEQIEKRQMDARAREKRLKFN